LPIPVIKSIIKAKGVKNTILVSDLSPLGGLKPGLYRIWGSDVTLSNNGFLFNPASGYLAASSFSLLDCANFLLGTGFVSLKDLSLMAFYNPLRLLGIHPSAYSRNVNVKLKGNKLHVAH
jgi:N-acetylglucosamine-6-phosphate deacetylase